MPLRTMTYSKKYWENFYKNNTIGWDVGYITTPIKEYIDQLTDKKIKILIPGAGNSYEAAYLHNKGFTEVYVLEFAEEPINNFLKRVQDFPKNHIIKQDFFEHIGQYDLIIEQTFFSSLKPQYRPDYVHKTADLLKKNGKLIGLLFTIEFGNDYPPFGGNKKIYQKLFNEYFEIETMEIAYNSIKPRKNNELFIKLVLLRD